MRKSIAMTAFAATVFLLAGCKQPPETPVANDTVEPAPAPERRVAPPDNPPPTTPGFGAQ